MLENVQPSSVASPPPPPPVGEDVRIDFVQELERRLEGASAHERQGVPRQGEHQLVAGRLGAGREHRRIAPEDALRAKADAGNAGRARQAGGRLPEFRQVAALEAEGPHERLALNDEIRRRDGNVPTWPMGCPPTPRTRGRREASKELAARRHAFTSQPGW